MNVHINEMKKTIPTLCSASTKPLEMVEVLFLLPIPHDNLLPSTSQNYIAHFCHRKCILGILGGSACVVFKFLYINLTPLDIFEV
jgi:hypothetical protein